MIYKITGISKSLKPDSKRVLVFILSLLIVFLILPALSIYTPFWHCGWGWAISCNLVSSGIGFPFVFYSYSQEITYFRVKFLLYDLLFWYVVSCLIIYIYENKKYHGAP